MLGFLPLSKALPLSMDRTWVQIPIKGTFGMYLKLWPMPCAPVSLEVRAHLPCELRGSSASLSGLLS